ncbi:hypothetical protein WJX84_002675 [Apatococcus fuscideae]
MLVIIMTILYFVWKRLFKQIRRREQHLAVTSARDLDTDTLRHALGQFTTPSWMQFPDFERVGWVNSVIGQLWPHVSSALVSLVQDKLPPLLDENRPRWMTAIELHTFTLGNEPPQVNGVKVYHSDAVTDEVVIEVDVAWGGTQQFQLVVYPLPRFLSNSGLPVDVLGRVVARFVSMRVGVRDLTLSGKLRISFRPLLNKLPVVGSIKVSLLDMPQFSYNLNVYGGDVTFLPGLEVWLNSLLQDTVFQPLILPEGRTIPIAPGLQNAQMPAGMLYLHIVEAENVPRMDWLSPSDPYIQLWLQPKHKRRTETHSNNPHPMFDEDFELLVHEPDYQAVTFVLFDANTISKDEEIGRMTLPIKDLQSGETKDLWLELGPAADNRLNNPLQMGFTGVQRAGRLAVGSVEWVASKFRRKPRGTCRMHVEATFYRIGAEQLHAAEAGASAERLAELTGHPADSPVVRMLKGGVLYVTVKKGQDVAHRQGTRHMRATQVRVKVVDQERSTAAASGQQDPGWDETLDFAISGEFAQDNNVQIWVECWDYHWVNYASDNLTWGSRLGDHQFPPQGTLSVPLHEVISQRHVENSYHLEGVPEGTIDLGFHWVGILDTA